MSKKVVRIASFLLAVIMVVSIPSPTTLTVFATDTQGEATTETPSDAPPDEEEPEQTISKSEALEQMNALEDQLAAVKDEIANIESNIESQESTQAYYEQQSGILANQIEILKADIATQQTALAQKEAELEAKVLQLEDTKTLFEDRLKALYIMRDDNQMSTLLGVTSYADALRYGENLQQISISDTELITRLRIEEAELDLQAVEIELQVNTLLETQAQLDAKSIEYQAALSQVNAELSESQATLAAQEAAYGDLAEQFKEAQATWLSFAAPSQNLDFVYDGGFFSWPLPGYYSISSDYNEVRYIYGVYDVHRGIDMPAPAGVTIYAAADGVVSTNVHWSYGTTVKIDHGSGLVSLYAHMSARYVNAGDYVVKGQAIGAVGTTGNSTGNHLHFEVNLNSATVDPRVYLDPSVVAQLR